VFVDVFRWDFSDLTVTPLQDSETAAFGVDTYVTDNGFVTDQEASKPAEMLGCNGVTDEKPE